MKVTLLNYDVFTIDLLEHAVIIQIYNGIKTHFRHIKRNDKVFNINLHCSVNIAQVVIFVDTAYQTYRNSHAEHLPDVVIHKLYHV